MRSWVHNPKRPHSKAAFFVLMLCNRLDIIDDVNWDQSMDEPLYHCLHKWGMEQSQVVRRDSSSAKGFIRHCRRM